MNIQPFSAAFEILRNLEVSLEQSTISLAVNVAILHDLQPMTWIIRRNLAKWKLFIFKKATDYTVNFQQMQS